MIELERERRWQHLPSPTPHPGSRHQRSRHRPDRAGQHPRLTQQVAERMYVVFARVLDQLGLTEQQRAMLPGLLQAAVAGFSGSESPAGSARQLRQIEGTVIDDEWSVQSG